MQLGAAIVGALQAVLQVLIISAGGFYLVKAKLLKKEGTKAMASVIANMLLPCLHFSRLSKTVTVDALSRLYILPTASVLFVLIGSSLGQLIRLCTRPEPSYSRVVVACCTCGNSAGLPMVVMVALTQSVAPFSADAGAADRAVSYIAAYLSLYGLLMWAGVYPYLQGAQRERELSEMLPQAQAARDDSEAPTEKAEDAAGEGARSPATPTRRCACYGVLKRFLKRFASPVVIAILCGLGCGCVPVLRALLVADDGKLNIVWRTTFTVGSATIPLSAMIVGANLAFGSFSKRTVSRPALVGATLTRLVLLPAIGLGFSYALQRAGMLGADPLVPLVLVMESCVPTANNIVMMGELVGSGAKEASEMIFVQYIFVLPALTAVLAAALMLFVHT